MAIKIVAAKAHQELLDKPGFREDLAGVEKYVNNGNISFSQERISAIIADGKYKHFERQMGVSVIFVNTMDKPITELHGVLRLKFKNVEAQIAKATVNFGSDFIGVLNPGEGMYVFINIPVKGLTEDRHFVPSEMEGSFDEVRVTFEGLEDEEETEAEDEE